MADYKVTDTELTYTANRLRAKGGSSNSIEWKANKGFGDAIDDAIGNFEEMTMAEYEALSQAKKMDGTVRFITDVSALPNASGVGF